MNQYYQSLIKELLKDDITKSFDKIDKSIEIDTIVKEIINNYFNDYQLIIESCFDKYNIVENKGHKYRDRIKYNHRNKDRCIARIWNCGMGGQCSRNGRFDGFCKIHSNKGGEDWWLGTINNPRPERPINHNNKIHIWLN